jgi:hypothetical protein
MPFKSQAQRRKFAELLVKGEISPDTFEAWNRETGGKHLPERVTRKTAQRKTKKRKTAKKEPAKKKPAKASRAAAATARRPRTTRAGRKSTTARAKRHSK